MIHLIFAALAGGPVADMSAQNATPISGRHAMPVVVLATGQFVSIQLRGPVMSDQAPASSSDSKKTFTAHGAFKPTPAFCDLHSSMDRDTRKQTLRLYGFVLLCVFIGFTAGMVATTIFTEINKARIKAEQ